MTNIPFIFGVLAGNTEFTNRKTETRQLLFQMITDELPTTQVNYLKALLAGEKQLSSKSTIDTYRLGTSANVIRIKQALLEKEILDETGSGPEFLDPYYAYWLKTRYFV